MWGHLQPLGPCKWHNLKKSFLLKWTVAGEYGPVDVFAQALMDKNLIIKDIDLGILPETSAEDGESMLFTRCFFYSRLRKVGINERFQL